MNKTETHPNPSGVLPRWNIVETPFYARLCLGNATCFQVFAAWIDGARLFVGVEGQGAYTFGRYAHFTYVKEKLNVTSSDARALADWINTQLGIRHPTDEQGAYDDQYCEKGIEGAEKLHVGDDA